MPSYEYAGRRPSLPDDESCWIAPSADLIGDVQIGREASIWFGVVIRADNTPIVVGDRSNIQEGSVLHSDPGAPLTIGTGSTIGHHATLHGCTIGNNVLVGMGATVLNHAVIGDNCLIGANALVTEGKIFPPGSMIIGAPAKAVRDLDEAAIASLRRSAAGYVEKQALYRDGLKRVD